MKKTVIVTGGDKDRISFNRWCQDADIVIGVDGGAVWLLDEGLPMDLAVGDFDTAGTAGLARLVQAGIRTETHPPEKDMTDTELAMHTAASMGATEIVLFGGLGSRFDHSLANLQLLWRWYKQGIPVSLVDPCNAVQITGSTLTVTGGYPYISLLPFTPVVEGICLEGFKYPLSDAVLRWGESLGISNELVKDSGTIRISGGDLLVIQAMDKHEG